MLRILHDTKYDFIKWWRVAVGSTVVFIAAGLIFLGIHGLNRSIEFTGGTLMQVEFKQPPDAGQLRQIVDAAGYPGSEIQPFGSPREFTIRAAGHDVSSSVAVPALATRTSELRKSAPNRAFDPVISGIVMVEEPIV